MTSIRRPACAAITVLTLAAAAACSAGGDSASGTDTGEGAEFDVSQANRDGGVVVGDLLQDLTLDPAGITGYNNLTYLAPIYDTLLRRTPEGELEPGLAESWDVVDADTISLTLRPDVTFSDGTPVDAEAIGANLMRMKAVDTGEMNIVLQELNEVVAESPTEATIELAAPASGEFLYVLSGPESLMVSPTALNDPSIDIESQAVGAGPYEVVSYRPGENLQLQRKEDYWDVDNWPLKTIEIRQVADGAPRVTALSAGDIQFMLSGDATVVPALENNPAIEVLSEPGQYLHYVNYCKKHAPFDDPDVRRAFEFAIDRSSLVDALTAGDGAPAYQVWPEDSPNFNPDAVREQDLEQARELLGGREVTVNMAYISFVAGHDRAMEIMQAQLAEVGIELNIKPVENLADLVDESNDALLVLSSHQSVGRIARQLGPDSVNNMCGYDDPAFNELLDQVRELDPESAEARDAWHQVAERVNEDALMLPLFYQVNVTGFQASEIGSRPFTTPYIDFRYVYAK